ncbi:MAG: hypothetical protein M3Z24_15440 [Chloroflexota bacterium]|nr:hypothetical protein [Chloroflexota bacterium]
MKKTMRLLSMLLAISGSGMLLLAGAVDLSIVWYISMAMLIVAAIITLVTACIEGNGGDNIGSYRMPRT